MNILIEFQKLSTIFFVVFYCLGGYFLLKSIGSDISNIDDHTSIVIAGLFCLGVSHLFFQGIVNQAGEFLHTYQKITVYTVSIVSCAISFMYLMTVYKQLHPLKGSDITLFLASIIQSSIMIAIMIEYKIRKYESQTKK